MNIYIPDDIWNIILYDFLWPKNCKYWNYFKSKNILMLELTKKNLEKYDKKTVELCKNYNKYNKFFKLCYIPYCFKSYRNYMLYNKYELIYKLQNHISNKTYIIVERNKILTRCIKYMPNWINSEEYNKYNKELYSNKEILYLIKKSNKHLINTHLKEERDKTNNIQFIKLLNDIENVSRNICYNY